MTPAAAAPIAAAEPLLVLQGVTKEFHGERETTTVFTDLDLHLERGEITCLLGASGCGKSTLLSMIAGLMVPDAGRVFFDGLDVAELSDSARAHLRATRLGIVLQSGNLVPFLSARENVALAMRLAGSRPDRDHVSALLDQVGLADRADHLPRRLSGGEAQRAALAVSLANDPVLLLADEAVGQLDTATAHVVLDLFRRACRERGLAVLLVTHSEEIAALGSRIIRMTETRS